MILSIKLSNPTNSPRNSLNVIDALACVCWFVSAESERGRDRMRPRSRIRLPARGTCGVSCNLLGKISFGTSRKWSICFFLAYIFDALLRARSANRNSATFITRINERFIMISAVSQTSRIERRSNISSDRDSLAIYIRYYNVVCVPCFLFFPFLQDFL